MTQSSGIDEGDLIAAERLARTRMSGLLVFTVLFTGQQLALILPPFRGRPLDTQQLFICTALDLLGLAVLLIRTGSHKLGPVVMAMLNDEFTAANRASALGWGFVAMIVAVAVCSIATLPSVPAIVLAQAIGAFGIIIANLRWVWRDWRADG